MRSITHSLEETKQLANKLAQKYHQGGVITLTGPLGAGKTTFAQGFAQGLGIKEKIISPTFIIKREYPLPNSQEGKFYHLDLYRLDNILQMEELGLLEIFDNPSNVILIEWAEKLQNLLPKKTVKIQFITLSKNSREIEIVE